MRCQLGPPQRSIGSLRLGISSVPMSLGQLTAMEGDWAGGLGAFAREQELDLFVLMLYHDGPRFERELVAVDAGGGLWVRGLDALRAGGVELEASRCGQGRPQVRCYAQVDPRFSRKQILHLLQKGLGAPASGAP